MTHKEFEQLLTEIQTQEREVSAQGREEYTRGGNELDNFERIAVASGITREQVLLVYATKHFDGIRNWVKGKRSQRENVQGRIKDLRLYLALLWAMANEDDERAESSVPMLDLPVDDAEVLGG